MFEKAIKGLTKVIIEGLKIEDKEVIASLEKNLDQSAIEISAVVEAEVNKRVNEKVVQLEEDYNTKKLALDEDNKKELQKIQTVIFERLDEFTENTAKEYIKANEAKIVSEAKNEIIVDVYETLKSVLIEKAIIFEEENVSALEKIQEENEKLRNQLNESESEKISLNKEIKKMEKEKIFEEVTKTLAITEKLEFSKLTDTFIFENAKKYKEQLESVFNLHFKQTSTTDETTEIVENIEEVEGNKVVINNIDDPKPTTHSYFKLIG